jgi:endonuclease-3
MQTKQFLKLLSIIENNLPSNTPAMRLRNCYIRNPYTILMTTLLSLRTKDENTTIVASKLFGDDKKSLKITTPQELLKIDKNTLENIIKPTGMYKQKTQTLLDISKRLIDEFDTIVPNSKEELLSFKGIGDKTANIVLNNAFGIANIAVDTHVHRICNLLGVIDTKDEKQSSEVLNKIIPNSHKSKLNFTIVSFGQTICKVKNPLCEKCPISQYCPTKIAEPH